VVNIAIRSIRMRTLERLRLRAAAWNSAPPGGFWDRLRIGALILEGRATPSTRAIARNRYRWFGHSEYCARLTPGQRSRLL
jgi:hypothetical protein